MSSNSDAGAHPSVLQQNERLRSLLSATSCLGDINRQIVFFRMEIQLENERELTDQTNTKEDLNRVNLSNTGLTIVPTTLFKRLNITHLDVSDNNIKNLPPAIANLVNLQYLNLCRNGFQCTSSEDTTVLPISMKKLRSLEYLNISECNLLFIPATIWEITSLKQLDISRNNIGVLPPNIGNLDNLVWLNSQYTGLSTLPLEIVGCEKLETLLLYGNKIQTIPYLLADIKNLKIFAVNLSCMAENIDSNMESLLHSGQILSDHISNTIFNLPSIKRVEMEFCKINYLKKFQSKELEELHLRGNFFREISNVVLDVEKLMTLDLSKNILVDIPDDIIKLENLKILMLQENCLENLSGNIFHMKRLQELDVSRNKLKEIKIPLNCSNTCFKTLKACHNNIEEIPDNIINLESLQDLDVTANKIKEIPINLCSMKNIKFAHVFRGLQKVGLWILNNPIEFPPKNVWNTTNIEDINQFLERSKIERLHKRTPVRIILLGENNSEKNNFLDKFLCRNSCDIDPFIRVYRWMSPNSVPFVFVSINCHSIYSPLMRHFIDNNSLIWLFINGDANDKLEQIEQWVDLIIDYSIKCVIQIIIISPQPSPTDSDGMNNNGDILTVNTKKQNDKDNHERIVIETLKERYVNENISFLPDILEYSFDGSLNSFKDQLEYTGINNELFPEDSFSSDLQIVADSIEKICKSFPCIYININELMLKVEQVMTIPSDHFYYCLKSLHKQGKILWFYYNKKLSNKVYPFIGVFNKSICSLLRPNYDDELNIFENPLLRAEGLMNENQFSDIRRNFLNYGETCYPLYKILSFELQKSSAVKDFLVDAEIGWTVSLSPNLEENIFERPYLVLPVFNKEKFDKTYFLQSVLLKKEYQEIYYAATIRSKSLSCNSDLFLNLRCAVNKWALRRFDWENLVYIIHSDGDIIIFKNSSDKSHLNVNIIERRWSKDLLNDLPCEGNFRNWIDGWYAFESEIRNNFSYNIVDVSLKGFDQYICEYINF